LRSQQSIVYGILCDHQYKSHISATINCKDTVKCTLVQALRLCIGRTAHRGSRGIALLFHDHGTRRGEGSASRPGRSLTSGKTRVPLYRRLGGPQGRSGQVWKISPPPGFDPRTVQPVASRYTPLRYPAHNTPLRTVSILSSFPRRGLQIRPFLSGLPTKVLDAMRTSSSSPLQLDRPNNIQRKLQILVLLVTLMSVLHSFPYHSLFPSLPSTPPSSPLAVTLSMLHSEFTLITGALECMTSVCDVTDNVICEGQTKGVVLKRRIQDK
jgi:hypothetical protein